MAGTLIIAAASSNSYLASSTREREARETLAGDWSLLQSYLRLGNNPRTQKMEVNWFYDRSDRQELAAASRIQSRCLIADESGRVIFESRAIQDTEIVGPPQIMSRTRAAFDRRDTHAAFWFTEH